MKTENFPNQEAEENAEETFRESLINRLNPERADAVDHIFSNIKGGLNSLDLVENDPGMQKEIKRHIKAASDREKAIEGIEAILDEAWEKAHEKAV